MHPDFPRLARYGHDFGEVLWTRHKVDVRGIHPDDPAAAGMLEVPLISLFEPGEVVPVNVLLIGPAARGNLGLLAL